MSKRETKEEKQEKEQVTTTDIKNPEDYKNVDAWLNALKSQGPEIGKSEKNDSNTYLKVLLYPRIGEMMVLKLWPSLKDFTECEAGVSALCNHLKNDLKLDKSSVLMDTKVACYVIGDGKRPQTAALIGLFTRWQIFSIDPQLTEREPEVVSFNSHGGRDEDESKKRLPENVTICRQRAEDFNQFVHDASMSIVLAVHSHADLNAFWQRLTSKLSEKTLEETKVERNANTATLVVNFFLVTLLLTLLEYSYPVGNFLFNFSFCCLCFTLLLTLSTWTTIFMSTRKDDVVKPYEGRRVAVAIPCCKKQFIQNLRPAHSYIDLGIHPRGNHDTNLAKRGVVLWSELFKKSSQKNKQK
jgi:hypothetical protein